MNPVIKDFIKEHIGLIETEDWRHFFFFLQQRPATYLPLLPAIYDMLMEADINPFNTKLDQGDVRNILESLGDIDGFDVKGKYAQAMIDNELREGIDSKESVANIALQCGFDVYETPDGFYGSNLDYVILNPKYVALKYWYEWNLEAEGIALDDPNYEFDPSRYSKLISINE